MAARVVLALVIAVLLAVWSALLSLVALLVPRTVMEGMPAGELALRMVARVLVGWTYAVFGLLLLLLTRRSRGFGTTFFAALVLSAGALNLLLLVPAMVLAPFAQELASSWLQLASAIMPAALLDAGAALDVRLVVLPAAYVLVFWLLARRAVVRAAL